MVTTEEPRLPSKKILPSRVTRPASVFTPLLSTNSALKSLLGTGMVPPSPPPVIAYTPEIFSSSRGEVFYVVGGYNNRERLKSIDDVSVNIRNAVMALEDARFYDHIGIDVIRIAGALVNAVKNPDRLQGASTITQQLMKNTVLSHEKSLSRKIAEIGYALSVETAYEKDDIFRMYLNTAYFGNGYYGVEKAAQGYFGTPAKDVPPEKACMLAALIKKPEGYNPFKKGDALSDLTQRQHYCLRRMYTLGYLDQTAAEAALTTRIVLTAKPLDQSNFHEFYATWVLRQLETILGSDVARTKGLRIHTPMNRDMQNIIEDILIPKPGKPERPNETAVIVIDHRNGNVVAMLGGKNFSKSHYNKATQARRQLGSSFKPFVYAAAFESGISPDDTLIDEPVEYYSENDKGEVQVYMPENYNLEYAGRMSLREALIRSNNIISVKLLNEIRPDAVVQLTKKMNIVIDGKKGLCLALGCSELTLEEMAAGYQIFAAAGVWHPPVYITRVEDRQGNELYRHDYKSTQVISELTAQTIKDILTETVRSGTAKMANPGIVPAAGKTGTTDDYRDAWFMGFTPDYTAGVWVGNEDNSPTDGEVGGGAPAFIWKEMTVRMYRKARKTGTAADNQTAGKTDSRGTAPKPNAQRPAQPAGGAPDNTGADGFDNTASDDFDNTDPSLPDTDF
ncbi:hypothetical protein CHS0354_018501 [Potamilus streckersoni]|uniref:peptidoglycan glycosyltransferase n=1 Tax=Potamilus streckersoni TaxID=2493646 RepID=A0AAE0TAQ9_9BIVA|nr:hypothetical protein CHS0354_018501 [Potamilus streckersoni]